MDKRYADVLQMLPKKAYMTSKALAEKLQVSDKTIQKIIKALSEVLQEHGGRIEVKHRQGYRLIIENQSDYDRFLESTRMLVPGANKERVSYILRRLVEAQGYLQLADLEKELFVSKNTLSFCMKTVEEILEKNALRLERRPRYGLRVEGSEFFKRQLLMNYFEDEKKLALKKNEELFSLLTDIVAGSLRRQKFSISDFALSNLIIHLYIAIQRICRSQYIEKETLDMTQLKSQPEYKVAIQLLEDLEQVLDIEFPESEIAYLTIHLAGKKMPKESAANNVVISQDIQDMAAEMTERVYKKFNLDFRSDLDLQMSLGQHLIALETRIKYQMEQKNPLLEEIKESCAAAFAAATEAAVVINRRFETRLSEHEIGYFALIFALAIERTDKEIEKKNIVLVCATGKGSAELLKYKYRKEFGKYIDQLYACDANELAQLDFQNIDYVITTVPIQTHVPKPIMEVSYFLDSKEILEIRTRLFDSEKAQSALEFYHEELFIPNLEAKNKDEVIEKMCRHIAEKRKLPAEFKALIHSREKLARTEFGNKVALPHPNENVVDETFVCVAVLAEPIIWEEKEVQVIFLVAVEKNLSKSIQVLYQTTAAFLLSQRLVNELIEKRDFTWLRTKLEENAEEG